MPANEFDYEKLSNNSLSRFVQEVAQIIEESSYDLIMAGGDSGNIMAWITSAVYEQLRIPSPPKIVLPIYRHADYAETILFDNRVLSAQIPPINDILKNVLIVDDEVGHGNTLKGLLDTLQAATGQKPNITFIAENDNFDVSKINEWQIDFRSPQDKVKDVYNAVSYIVPGQYQSTIRRVLEPIIEDMNDKHIMATLLDLPIKEFNAGNPIFTFKYRDECAKQIENFKDLQGEFQDFIYTKIKQSSNHDAVNLIDKLINKHSILPSSLKQVQTAGNRVLSNGHIYIKVSSQIEVDILKVIYPNYFIDAISKNGIWVFAMNNIGSIVEEHDFTSAQFHTWANKIKQFWKIDLSKYSIPKLNVNQEISLLYTAIDKDEYQIKSLLDKLLDIDEPIIHHPLNDSLLHGDLNFRNILFDNKNDARLLDFDHAKFGPIEWDISNILVVCLIADRQDLYEQCLLEFSQAKQTILNYYLRIRLAQTLVHTATHIGFETFAGLRRRIDIANDFLDKHPSAIHSHRLS